MARVFLFALLSLINWTLVNCQLLPVDEGTPWPCNTSGECPAGHCCVSVTRPRGKRQITNGSSGYCHPLGQLSHACFVSDRLVASQLYHECPCRADLRCTSNGVVDRPLGEMGNCLI